MTARYLSAPEPEPAQRHADGATVTYRRDDGRMGLGTVASYDQATGRYRIQTKNSGVVVRYWTGVAK